MLNMMRSSSALKYVLFAIIFLAMGGLALVNQGTFLGSQHGMIVARVGGTKISRADFDRGFETLLRQNRTSRTDAIKQGLPEKQLNREVNTRLFSLVANDMGIIISDDLVRQNIKMLVQPYTDRGIDEKQALQQLLYANNTTESDFVSIVRSNLATQKLLEVLGSGAQAPGQMIDDAMKFRYEWRRGAYFKLTAADLDKIPDPSDADLKAYYKTISDRFMLPEYRSFSVLVLDKESVGGKSAGPTDADLKAYYDKHIDSYSAPETRKIAQVIVSDQDMAKKLYADAKAGQNLKALAVALGKDKATYIENTYSANALPDELADAFKAKEGTLMEPVQSPLGWHVLDIEKVIPAAPKPFESVKADVVKSLSSGDQSTDALYKLANDVDDMVGGGQNLSEVAAHYGLKLHKFTALDAQGNGEDGKKVADDGVPEFAKALSTAFTAQKDVPSQEIETAKGAFLLVEVSDITPAQEQPFDKVRTDVLKAWRIDQDNAALDAKTSKIMERIKLGDSFDKIADSLGKKPAVTDLIQRQEQYSKDTKLERGMVPALFSIDKVGEVTTVNGVGSVIVMKLADRKIDLPKDPKREDMDALRNLLSQSIQNDLLTEYRTYLVKKYDVETYPEVLADMYKVDNSGNDAGADE